MNTKLTYLVEAIVLVIVFPYFFFLPSMIWTNSPLVTNKGAVIVIAIITID